MPEPHARNIEPSPWVVRFASRLHANSRVLDLACGKGRHTRLFLEAGHSVTAVDRDLSEVSDLSDDERLSLIQADLEDGGPWPLRNLVFDAVVVVNYLWRELFPDIMGSVAPGGLLIYETFAEGNERFGKPKNPDYLLREDELLDVVAGELEVIEYEHVEVQVPKPAIVQRICARRLASG
ncbi:MAG: class I SAM-dependent methyltransferase [Planctomycetota bacterium]